MSLVTIKADSSGRLLHFFYDKEGLRVGDRCLFQEADGLGIGVVERVLIKIPVPRENGRLLRQATEEEIEESRQHLQTENRAFEVARGLIGRLGLSMKLINTRYPLQSRRITFYYTAKQRVDFRRLVKELASVFRVRIQMQQIGVRDEPQLLGGMGICGRRVCCASFLSRRNERLDSVSLETARAQNLPLVSSKISGICGRLRCCLNFEYETYCELEREFPGVGTVVGKGDKAVRVVGCNLLRGTVVVENAEGVRKAIPKEQLIE